MSVDSMAANWVATKELSMDIALPAVAALSVVADIGRARRQIEVVVIVLLVELGLVLVLRAPSFVSDWERSSK